MIIEIRYSYQFDKSSPEQKSWTYFYTSEKDLTKAKAKAKTYWKKFCTELGWKARQVKLNHIEEILNEENHCPEFIVVSKSELPPARKRRSTPTTKKTSSRRVSSSPRRRKKSV